MELQGTVYPKNSELATLLLILYMVVPIIVGGPGVVRGFARRGAWFQQGLSNEQRVSLRVIEHNLNSVSFPF